MPITRVWSPPTFGPGSLLGEIDFFLGRPHSYTARTSSEVTAWALDNQALPHILAERPEIGLSLGLAFGTGIAQFQTYLADALEVVPLLQDLSSDERKVIARLLSPQRYLPRETIYRSGDSPSGIFFIEQGQAWLLSDMDNHTRLSPGQTFGEQAVILGRRHTDTAQAATDLIVWQLSPADFAALAQTHPAIKDALHQNLRASLTETLAIASVMVNPNMRALEVACG
ncbi:MAG: cyclic nucleotide-binding domain-containing protein [Anaerolineae bacterium]|nr:cyclic nucleotide-binding domain-containing protein [Anaerolineae bacterium]